MATMKSAFNLETCARPNILKLQPYRCARDDYEDNGTNILLDANENAYGPGLDLSAKSIPKGVSNGTSNGTINGDYYLSSDVNIEGLNRYPDPHQIELKKLICNLRNPSSPSPNQPLLDPSNLFVGVGSDEAIDTLMRVFCPPGRSSILVCPPTYGMYTVSAHVNDLSVLSVPLLTPSFAPDIPAITATLTANPSIKILYLCSPGNPTGALIPRSAVEAILAHPTWNGVLVVDEAYVDFAVPPPSSSPDSDSTSHTTTSLTNPSWPCPSLAPLVSSHPNLVVLGTLSKAHGLAGLRLGYAITSPPIASLMNALKAPYNISAPTSALAIRALQPPSLALARKHIQALLVQRGRLVEELPRIPGLGRIKGGLDANFVMVEVLDGLREEGRTACNVCALGVYERLAAGRGVVVRFRGKEHGCEGCLRVTIGTEAEVGVFLREIRGVLGEVLGLGGEGLNEGKGARKVNGKDREEEERREVQESEVVA